MSDWKVVHVINNEKLSSNELVNKYPKYIEKMAVKMINILASKYEVEVKMIK